MGSGAGIVRAYAVLAAFALLSCASAKPVDTPEAAIAVAAKACAAVYTPLPLSYWEAESKGDHWFVWTGAKVRPDLWINVPKDGRRPDGRRECEVHIIF
jgi:hypothetical protein